LDDGGSLSFYKEIGYRSFSRLGSEKEVKIKSHQSIFTRGGALNKSESVKSLDVDEQMKAKIEKIKVSASVEKFVAPIEMPYLHIPADVPWTFKSLGGNLKSSAFQIIIPPFDDGCRDCRVKVMTSKEKEKNMRQVTTMIGGREMTFASVIQQDDDRGRSNGFSSDHYHDSTSSIATTSSRSIVATASKSGSAKNTEIFTFLCENPHELAVYTETAQTLGRVAVMKRRVSLALLDSLPKQDSRVRDVQRMEVAAQASLIAGSHGGMLQRSLNTIGKQEFRYKVFHAYPNTWLTEEELAEDMIRPSSHFHDFRKGGSEEIGSVKIEVLQCIGMPKMDRCSLSDPVVYIVCGAATFVTDVVPDNLNPVWLSKTRRACILPLHNAYSQVFVGAFDDDGEKEEDDFTGRVVLDIPRLHAGVVYDLTLPLRRNSRVYTRKRYGNIRMRVQVNWTDGERAALLSYIPKSPTDITRRLRKTYLEPKTLVQCPDRKSFQNVCHAVYGEDIPGKFDANIAAAVSKELNMISIVLNYHTKRVIRDIIRWNNPLLSSYIFGAWMYFVYQNSLSHIPSFIMSLMLVFMLRNYVKYYLHSVAGTFYGSRSIGSMCRIVLFNRFDANVQRTPSRRAGWLVSKVFGISTASFTKETWKEEDNAEYPFSIGTYHPKRSSDEAAATPVWIPEDEWNSDEEEEDMPPSQDATAEKQGVPQTKDSNGADSLNNDVTHVERRRTMFRRGSIADFSKDCLPNSSKDTSPAEETDGATTLNDSTCPPRLHLIIPEQDVKAKSAKKKGNMQQDIEKVHLKVSRASLHLFEDRVFQAEDMEEAKKMLSMNNSKNPIRRKFNPVLGGVMKMFEIQLSFVRAVFNVCMWNDPMLSFWISMVIFGLAVVLFIFPWRLFFFVIGFLGLGPQNYFLYDLYLLKRASKSKKTPTKEDPVQERRKSMNTGDSEDVSRSPLLFRENVWMKPDGKRREVIIPGGDCVFRFNRFYDWPPEPATTKIGKEM